MGSRGSAKLRGRLEGGPPSRTRPRVQARDDVVRDPDPGATHAVRHRVRVDVVVELRARVRVDLFADVVRFVDRIGRRRTLQDRHNVRPRERTDARWQIGRQPLEPTSLGFVRRHRSAVTLILVPLKRCNLGCPHRREAERSRVDLERVLWMGQQARWHSGLQKRVLWHDPQRDDAGLSHHTQRASEDAS